MAGIKDVAKKAGVSISTVSNVINGTKAVSPELRQKVNAAIADLHYEVNPVGRGLKSNKTNQVGVVVASFNQVYFPSILQGIHEAAFNFGYVISVFETGGDLGKEQEYVRFLQRSWVDGIILASSARQQDAEDQAYVQTLAKSGNHKKKIPIVSLESALSPSLDAVVVDHKKAAKMAMGHLLDQGHRDIAHVTAPLNIEIGTLRLEGYREALAHAGLSFDQDLIREGNYSPISGYTCMNALLDQGKGFTAVLAANDQMGIGVIRALLDRGLRVPEDVAVIGIDDNFPSTLITPALSSIKLPKYEMGFQAMSLLAERIKQPDKPAQIVTLDTELVIRRSTSVEGDTTWNLYNW